ncbi:MAG: phosphatase PAP2 family protein [Patescibacteria group bacterium]
MIAGFDKVIFTYLHSWAGVSSFIDGVVVFCAVYLLYVMIAAIILWTISSFVSKNSDFRKKTISLFWSAAASALISRLIIAEPLRILLARSRPYEVQALSHQLITHAMERSFPSGHATLAFAIAVAVYFYHRKAGVIFFLLACVIGASRVIVGVHWPSDIVGGIAVGIIGAWTAHHLITKPLWKKSGA